MLRGTSSVAATPQPGQVVQSVSTFTSTGSTTTTVIPQDGTIPQITEGAEFMSLSITPTSASNKLRIRVMANHSISTGFQSWSSALFRDSTANALAACGGRSDGTGLDIPTNMIYEVTAGSTAATTFRYRAGPAGAHTLRFNQGGTDPFGGVTFSGMVIEEIQA